jgi:hypothetical protein
MELAASTERQKRRRSERRRLTCQVIAIAWAAAVIRQVVEVEPAGL